jgi:hypothetical protein
MRTWKHRYRRRPVKHRSSWTGFEPPRHTMWTIEGQLEGVDRFTRSINAARGWHRWAGKTMLLLPVLAWMVVGFGVAIVWLARWAF